MTDLVTHSPTENAIEIIRDGNDLFVTSLEIADKIGNEHKNVLGLIKKKQDRLERKSRVAFKTQAIKTNGGTQNREVALLTERQATLLMTFFRNNDVVDDFKEKLVDAFFAMRDKLSEIKQIKEPTRKELAQLVLEAEEQLEKVTLELKEQKDINETFIATAENIPLRNAGKTLNQPPQKFIDSLKGTYLFYEGSVLVPYTKFLKQGIFTLKETEIIIEGEKKMKLQTLITPKGIDYFAKKLNVEIKKG